MAHASRLLRESLYNIHLFEEVNEYELNNATFNINFNDENELISVKGLDNAFTEIEKRLGYKLPFKDRDQLIKSLLNGEVASDKDTNSFSIIRLNNDEEKEKDETEPEEEISDLEIYNKRMAAGMGDKLFFLNKIDDVNTIVDFGCADGELLKLIPDSWNKIGIDNNSQMIKSAKKNCPDATYYSSLSNVKNAGSAVLNLSSVIHEIYSYLSEGEINKF